MSPAAREPCLRGPFGRLNEALMTLDLIDFSADANVAEIAAAVDLIHEQTEREVEGVIAQYLADAIDAAFSNFDWFTRRALQRSRAARARTRKAAP
jgi:hypothetical protein